MVSRMAQLFPGYEVLALCPFRITRNSDLLIDEGGADLLDEIAKSVKQRRWGDPVRLELQKGFAGTRAVDPGPIYAAGKAAGKSDEQIWAEYDEARRG